MDNVLEVTPLEIDVGADVPFRAVHASDTHLNFWDVTDYFGNAEREKFFGSRWVRFPQALNSLLATVNYVQKRKLPLLHTGDLIDWNSQGNTNVCLRVLRGVDMLYSPGNHEYHSSSGKNPPLSRKEMQARLSLFSGNDLLVASRIIHGVNFVTFDNSAENVSLDVAERVKAEFKKGLPVVLLCHIPPYYTQRFLDNAVSMRRQILLGQGESEAAIEKLPYPRPVQERYDEATRSFYGWLKRQNGLKAILCGHTHVCESDRFSDSAMMHVAGGNYEGCINEILFR